MARSEGSHPRGAPPQLRRLLAAALLCAAIAALSQGCVSTEDSLMPWAAPAPYEGSIPLPASMMRE